MRDWLQREPRVIVSGRGVVLRDIKGREYLDANSSIWTNLHGHRHPKIDAAIQRQLQRIAHSSALGLANEPASLLAAKLISIANLGWPIADLSDPLAPANRQSAILYRQLTKVFFSDDGSTAMEVALKLAYEFCRRARGLKRPRFLTLEGAYHGDTVGAVSLGHIDLFHRTYAGLLFKTDRVMAPYCYRCPFNRAKPERADARAYRKCHWECLGKVEKAFTQRKKRGEPYAAFVFEPLMQGAAGMIAQPPGWLRQAAGIARGHGALLIADEVMTGFGRTGFEREKVRKWESGKLSASKAKLENRSRIKCRDRDILSGMAPATLTFASASSLSDLPTFPPASPFASHHEGVQPDFLALAKGLTGGYVPMAATLTTQEIFDAFLGDYAEFKTFFHGHSYTSNQLGAAAALASLDVLQSRATTRARARLQRALHDELKSLWTLPHVGDIRQVGLIAGIELVKDWRTREPFALRERAGLRVCEAMARRGVLTRPIGNVVVLMPPYCTTPAQARRMVEVLRESVRQVLGGAS
jgi:adenosylmethionine-8-amino-7-oxononanoate aminotransferase